jgi:hypothetical protein
MPEYRIQAVIFRRGEHWIAKCLENGYVLQTRSRLEDVAGELKRALTLQIQVSLDLGVEPFTGFKPASRRYWEMYERASPVAEPVADGHSGPEVEARLAA